jgi:hypothetical protein
MRKVLSTAGYITLFLAALAFAVFMGISPQAIAQNTAIYFEQGGAKLHVGSGGTLVVDSGGTLDVSAGTVTGSNITVTTTATAAELNTLHLAATQATFAIAAGASNTTAITITVKNAAGVAVAYPAVVTVWWSSSSVGTGVATASSGAWTATTGVKFGPLTDKVAHVFQTNASGVLVITILDTNKATNYVCVQADHAAAPSVSRILAGSDYGA